MHVMSMYQAVVATMGGPERLMDVMSTYQAVLATMGRTRKTYGCDVHIPGCACNNGEDQTVLATMGRTRLCLQQWEDLRDLWM